MSAEFTSCLSRRFAAVALSAWGAAAAFAQTPVADQLALHQTRYRLRAGERVAITAPQETIDFIRSAKSRTLTVDGEPGRGLVVAPSEGDDTLLLAASLTAEPGEHVVVVSVVGPDGNEQQAELDVTLDPMQPVPSGYQRPPVVLLNGWQVNSSFNACQPSPEPFGQLENQLLSDGVPIVYYFDNCVEDPDAAIEDLGNALSKLIGLIRYSSGAPVPQVDLVGHSMGGLIVRSYLAGLQSNGTLLPPPNPPVRKFVQIATPNFGSFVAANFSGVIDALPGPQTAELIPGSAFLWDLATWNQGTDDLRGVDALAIVGNAGYWDSSLLSLTDSPNASDGVVSLTSASLTFARDPSRTRILPYCHIAPNPGANSLLGTMNCSSNGIEYVDGAPETSQIVRSFLAGTSNWMSIGTTPNQDPYLSQYGGIYFAEQTASAQWITNRAATISFGTVGLASGQSSGTVFYNEFVRGQGTFTDTTDTSFGSCGPFTEPPGYYTALRCKFGPQISAVRPLSTNEPGLVVPSGGSITISGQGFGQFCSSCGVWAYPGPVPLQVSTWNDQAIAVLLPATFSGLVQLVVQAGTGEVDSINILATAPPSISLSLSQVSFVYTVGGALPPQTVSVSNSGGGTLTWSASASAAWIKLSAASGVLTISISPAGLGPGQQTGTISVTAPGASNSPQTIAVSLVVNAAAPRVLVSAIVNAASGASGAIAPGEMVSIFGSGLGPTAGVPFSVNTSTGMVDSTLSGTRVFFGSYAAPITYTSVSQINAIVPYEVAGLSQVVMQVEYLGVLSAATTLAVGSAAPGIFTFNSTGSGQAAAANQNGSYNGPSNPAVKGSYLTIYFAGGGQTNPAGSTGSLNGSTLKWLAQSVAVTVGGQTATVTFDGAAPTFVDGLCQLNIKLADNTPSGPAEPIVIAVGTVSSPATATLAVQ